MTPTQIEVLQRCERAGKPVLFNEPRLRAVARRLEGRGLLGRVRGGSPEAPATLFRITRAGSDALTGAAADARAAADPRPACAVVSLRRPS